MYNLQLREEIKKRLIRKPFIPVYQTHKYAEICRPLSPQKYLRLKNKIQKNGYDITKPIYLYQNKILDGRARYQACIELNLRPEFIEFFGSDKDALILLLQNNGRR